MLRCIFFLSIKFALTTELGANEQIAQQMKWTQILKRFFRVVNVNNVVNVLLDWTFAQILQKHLKGIRHQLHLEISRRNAFERFSVCYLNWFITESLRSLNRWCDMSAHHDYSHLSFNKSHKLNNVMMFFLTIDMTICRLKYVCTFFTKQTFVFSVEFAVLLRL